MTEPLIYSPDDQELKKSRNKPGETSFLWDNIPEGLKERALAKCASVHPRRPLKWVLRDLLTAWVNAPDRSAK